jgi:hypothetical protein
MGKKVVIVPVKIRVDWIKSEGEMLDKRCCIGICGIFG